MAWKEGWTWTVGHFEKTINPDMSTLDLWCCSGPFYYHNGTKIFFYIGMRPTAPQGPGIGDEGWMPKFAQWRKRHGFGNIGIAFKKGKGG